MPIRYAILVVYILFSIIPIYIYIHSIVYNSFYFIFHYPYITPVSFDLFIRSWQRLASTTTGCFDGPRLFLRSESERTVHATNTLTNTLKALRWAIKQIAFNWPVVSPLMAIFDAPRDRVRRWVVPLPLPFTPFLEQCVLNPEVQRDTRVFASATGNKSSR